MIMKLYDYERSSEIQRTVRPVSIKTLSSRFINNTSIHARAGNIDNLICNDMCKWLELGLQTSMKLHVVLSKSNDEIFNEFDLQLTESQLVPGLSSLLDDV